MNLNNMQQRVNDDSALVHRGRFVTLTFTLGIGETDYLIDIAAGKITHIRQRHLPTDSGVFAIRASSDSWHRHWQPVPPRDYHDIFAMLAKDYISIDGHLTPLMQNLQYFKDVIASIRQRAGGPS
jgi:hypothetical protein